MVRACKLRGRGLAAEQLLGRRCGIVGLGERRQRLRIKRALVLCGCDRGREQLRQQQCAGASCDPAPRCAARRLHPRHVCIRSRVPPPPRSRGAELAARSNAPRTPRDSLASSAMRARAPRPGGKVTNYRHPSRFQTRCHCLRAAAIGMGEAIGTAAERSASPPASAIRRSSVAACGSIEPSERM